MDDDDWTEEESRRSREYARKFEACLAARKCPRCGGRLTFARHPDAGNGHPPYPGTQWWRHWCACGWHIDRVVKTAN